LCWDLAIEPNPESAINREHDQHKLDADGEKAAINDEKARYIQLGRTGVFNSFFPVVTTSCASG
jgi:hypothetical protein